MSGFRLCFVTWLLLAEGASSASAAAKKNVLFIAADDLNCRLGVYGDPIAKTPRLDALARKGVAFANAYSQYPLCNPSRVSLMVGVRPDTSGVYDLDLNFRQTLPDAVTLPQLFRNNGYFVARVGKLFHYGVPREIGTNGKDDPPSWDYVFNPVGRDKTEEDTIHLLTRGTGNTLGFSMAWLDQDGPDEDQTDAKGVTETIRLLKEKKNEPFFIGMGFFRPHTPFIAPKKYFDLYPPESITLPERDAASEGKLPPFVRTIFPDHYELSDNDLKDCVRAYYASISFVDAQVGRLLDALDELGLAESTLVVFWSDHGFLLGEHAQWQKQLLFDPSPRTPLIVYDPLAEGGGGRCEKPVELLDVYPTVADWAGLKKPAILQGDSLRPLLDDPKDGKWDHAAFSQVTRTIDGKPVMAYSVHTERYRYTDWGGHFEELYDHDADPGELRNLAGDPAHRETVAQLKGKLKAMLDANPPTPKAPPKAKKKAKGK